VSGRRSGQTPMAFLRPAAKLSSANVSPLLNSFFQKNISKIKICCTFDFYIQKVRESESQMSTEGSVKYEQILEAAIKRFSHFGINKTTLTEIAQDLAISKPSLFYYLNDKNSLITAVAGKIINETLEEFENTLSATDSVEDGLYSIVEIKRKYFKKYFLLAIQGESLDAANVSSGITEVFLHARKKMEILLSALLNKGVEQGALKPMDTLKTSIILLETLAAFEYCMKGRKIVPGDKDMDEMFNRQKDVLEMFLNGFRSKN
jgi:AcrR family transcriptional regulator